MALNGLLCADVPLSTYTLTHSFDLLMHRSLFNRSDHTNVTCL